MGESLFAPRRSLASRGASPPLSAEDPPSALDVPVIEASPPTVASPAKPREVKAKEGAEKPRSRSPRAPKDPADPMSAKDPKGAREPKDRKGSKDPTDARGGSDPKDPKDPKDGAKPSHGYAREAAALLLLASALYTSLALASFKGDPMRVEVVGADWVGPVGAVVAGALVQTVGLCAWLVPIGLALFAAPLLQGKSSRVTLVRIAGDLVVLLVASALLHVAFPASTAFGEMPLGGSAGELFGEVMRALFSTIGSYIVGLTVVSLILIGRAAFSIIDWYQRAQERAKLLREKGQGGLRKLAFAWDEARALEEKRRDEERKAGEPVITEACDDAIFAALADDSPAPFPRVKPLDLAPAVSPRVAVGAAPVVAISAGPGVAPILPAPPSPENPLIGSLARAARAAAPTPTPPAAKADRAKRTRKRTDALSVGAGEAASTAAVVALDAPIVAPAILAPPPPEPPVVAAALAAPAAAEVAPKVESAGPLIIFRSPDAELTPRSFGAQRMSDDDVDLSLGAAPSPSNSVIEASSGDDVAGVILDGSLDDLIADDPAFVADLPEPDEIDSPEPPAARPATLKRDVAPAQGNSPNRDIAPDRAAAARESAAREAAAREAAAREAAAREASARATIVREAAAREAAAREATAREAAAREATARELAAREAAAREAAARSAKSEPAAPPQPVIVDTSSALTAQKPAEIIKIVPAIGEGFRLPATTLLEEASGGRVHVDEDLLKQTAIQLEKVLADYGVSGKVEEIHPGPTVTTFEVAPAAGTKVSKVASLADDLALGLSRKVRIVAPIPGKNRIGFEIPNDRRIPVVMRELIEDKRFLDMKAPLPCVLGRDIIGAPYFADLASMPHVIVAGATGAGKSVGLNVMLVSLLYRRTPAELRLLMIDPKVVELAPFDGIPHMLLPVVTDMKQASNALKWAVDEMERRYQLFANAGTRNITSYNGWVERVQKGEIRAPKKTQPKVVNAIAPDGTDVEIAPAGDGTDDELPETLPFIVIVVDEFADLMMQQGKEVEASVARLAQKARAAGMHVILATQRPSVDVITGMIKANFPTRIAFRVAQKVDSRTILDEQGAEHLLGKGDMLVKMNGSNDTRRVQCPFCSEEEVQRVTDFLRLQGTPVYDENILKPRDEDGEDGVVVDCELDPMYDAAVRLVADTRRCSTSWIQRKLGVGYNRAAKMVEAMEKRGVVGPANGAKDREVLIGSL